MMRLGKSFSILIAAIIILAFGICVPTPPVKSQNLVRIMADGSLDPASAPIEVDGNNYTLQNDVAGQIVIERNNIVLNGMGHTVQGPAALGVDLTGTSNVTVCNLVVREFDTGIGLKESDGSGIVASWIINCVQGALISSSKRSRVESNILKNNSYAGIMIHLSNDSHVVGNEVTRSKYGVKVTESTGCGFLGNTIRENSFAGIYLNSLEQASFSLVNNEIESNGLGVWILNSCGNFFHHNSFNNSVNVIPSSSYDNVWDSDSEGNYWSDYVGPDNNSDGIGDLEHIIQKNTSKDHPDETDHYPLMGKFRLFSSYGVGCVSNGTVSMVNASRVALTLSSRNAFVRLSIPHSLIEPPYSFSATSSSTNLVLNHKTVRTNATHTWVYMVCANPDASTSQSWAISIGRGEEFQWWILTVLLLPLCFLVVVLIVRKRNTRRLGGQYRSRASSIDPVQLARILLDEDVKRRTSKIKEFEEEYGIEIRRREDSLKTILQRMGIKQSDDERK